MRIKNIFILLCGKLLSELSSLFSLGAGSTWPGHIGLNLNERFISEILSQNKHLKTVLVAGTNGKTTTSTLLKYILENERYKVFQNEEGSNLLNGMASSLIKNSSLSGKIDKNVAIFEVDENSLPLVLKEITPDAIVLLNLFRDQLDRYGEVDLIAKKWQESLQTLPKRTTVFLNADDPQIAYVGKGLNAIITYFGLAMKYLTNKEIPHDVDSVYCPSCGEKLFYRGLSYSHLGDYSCQKCGFRRPKFIMNELVNPLEGLYNLYNVYAASLVANKLFGISQEKIKKRLPRFKAAFGRQEQIIYKGKKVFLILSKNPTGFNQSISVILKKLKTNKDSLLVILNDRIPDGRDVSWIWDVDFENLPKAKHIYISGDRAYDMAIRLKYAEIPGFKVFQNLEDAVEAAVEAVSTKETLFIMPTYSGMLEVRQIISGKKFL